MNVFLVGGTGLIGRVVNQRLVDAGHAVPVFHRDRTTSDLPDAVTTVRGDRDDPEALRDALDAAAPNVVLDASPYRPWYKSSPPFVPTVRCRTRSRPTPHPSPETTARPSTRAGFGQS